MISLVNEFSAVLDTCSLLPISLCDLLLRLAEDPALYKPKWSSEILEELRRNLQGPKFKLDEAKAEYRIACMQSAFPEALISGYESLSESMPNNQGDRHILAAAVYGKASYPQREVLPRRMPAAVRHRTAKSGSIHNTSMALR